MHVHYILYRELSEKPWKKEDFVRDRGISNYYNLSGLFLVDTRVLTNACRLTVDWQLIGECYAVYLRQQHHLRPIYVRTITRNYEHALYVQDARRKEHGAFARDLLDPPRSPKLFHFILFLVDRFGWLFHHRSLLILPRNWRLIINVVIVQSIFYTFLIGTSV